MTTSTRGRAPSSTAGVGTMLAIQWRTGWRSLLAWVLGIALMMLLTASSLRGLYPTQADLDRYAATLTGGAVYVLNGRVAGVDTLGGAMSNEFALFGAFAVPILAVAVMARFTRSEEENGRLELLLAAAIGRRAPLAAALVTTAATLAVTLALCALTMAAFGASPAGAALYCLGLFGLGLVHAGVAAVAAQMFEHARGVWAVGLAVIVVTYLVRGAGAAQDSALVWASPLGWLDGLRAFGDARWWPLACFALTAAALVALAVVLHARRDVDAALLRARPAAPRASAWLSSPVGLALHEHRGTLVGWSLGAVVFMGVYGSLSQTVIDALEADPNLQVFLGAGGSDSILSATVGMFTLLLAMLSAAAGIAACGSLARYERLGLLETQLSAPRSRWAWLGAQVGVILCGWAVVHLVGALALAGATAASMGERRWFGEVLRAAAVHAVPALLLVALAVALFGLAPRWRVLAWVVFGVSAVLAYLGPGLQLPDAVMDLVPFSAVGSVPLEDPDPVAVTVELALAALLLVAGFVGLRRRDVPRG